jgi:hypothetical protein
MPEFASNFCDHHAVTREADGFCLHSTTQGFTAGALATGATAPVYLKDKTAG